MMSESETGISMKDRNVRERTKGKIKGLLCMAAAVLLLTACGDREAADGQGMEEAAASAQTMVSDVPVTFTMLYSGEYNPEYKCLERMRELTNVTLDVTAVPDISYDMKSRMLINSGVDMPDLISKTAPTSAQAMSGALLPISDYFDQMPYFMQFIKENDLQYLIEDARQADGKVYQLPVNTREVKTPSKQIFIRKDIFDKNGIAVPATYEELYQAAVRLKELYPDSYPLQVVYGNGNLLDMMAPSFGTSAGWGMGIDNFHYLEETDEWIFAPVSEEYCGLLEYLNRLYSEGLFNQEYTTFSNNTYVEMAVTGRAFVLMSDWLGEEKALENALHETGEEEASWVPIYPLEGPAGAYLNRERNATQTMVIAASAAEKEYFPELIRWLDWMYSPEGADLFSWGIEGETYTVDENGKKILSPDVKCAANPEGVRDIAKEYGTSNNCLTFVYPYDHEVATMEQSYLELIQREISNGAIPSPEPSIALTEEEISVQIRYNASLNDYVSQMTTRFIMGGASFDEWDAFVEECENRGSESLRELYNAAWKRMNGM